MSEQRTLAKSPLRVLFLCTHNSSRSQMAEGLLRAHGGPAFEVLSAGTDPLIVHPLAIMAMHEIGIDISNHRAKSLEEFREQPPVDLVITVCDEAAEACPYFPNARRQAHWGFADPSCVQGSEEERLAAFRWTRDQITTCMSAFLALSPFSSHEHAYAAATASMNPVPQSDEQLRQEVSAKYAQTALQVLGTSRDHTSFCCGPICCGQSSGIETQPALAAQASSSCCESDCCSSEIDQGNPITSDLYTQMELGEIPLAAALASLGCGNPTALAELKLGEKVLDLGSGGGIDVLLSAKRVGPTGFAYGLDMTDPMLELAERNRQEAGIENVCFLKGIIEAIPLPDNSVDVVISNCVINLSADKSQVLREAYRVLTPGGRFAVSDIVIQGELPSAFRRDMESWARCVAGALSDVTYRSLLHAAGFVEIEIEVTRRYSLDDVASSGARASVASLSPEERNAVDGQFISAFVRARKPEKQEV
jgi:arsenite methyltransferase